MEKVGEMGFKRLGVEVGDGLVFYFISVAINFIWGQNNYM